jgi:hypothetical protein
MAAEDPPAPMSYNDAMRAIGGKTVGDVSPQEADAVVSEMLRKHLGIPEGESYTFTEQDFIDALNAMPIEEYVTKRAAIAAYRIPHE